MISEKLRLCKIEYRENENLAAHSTMRVGGNADIAVFPSDIKELTKALEIVKNTKYIVIGGGSNVVFPSDGYHGTVIFTKKLDSIIISGNEITAECGAMMPRLASAAMNAGLSGLEFICGIPGTVGGGVRMNAGSYGCEISDRIIKCTYYDSRDGQIHTAEKSALGFSFRSSIFADGTKTVLSATFALTPDSTDNINAKSAEIIDKKRNSQPYDMPSAGSVFKPLDGVPMWKLIDGAGLRGYSVGGAKISEKHAGFIVNTGNATSEDIKTLIKIVKDKIYPITGKMPEEEIIFIE